MDGSVATGIAAAPGNSAGIFLSCEFRQIGSEGWNVHLKTHNFYVSLTSFELKPWVFWFLGCGYPQCSADIAWPCPAFYSAAGYYSSLTSLCCRISTSQHYCECSPQPCHWMVCLGILVCQILSLGSLLCFQHQLFVLVLCLDVPADLKPQYRVFCLFYRRWKSPWFIWRRDFWNLILCVLWTCTITFRPSVVVWECLGKKVCFIFFISWALMIFHTMCTESGQCWHDSVVRKHQAAKLSGWGEVWLQWCLKITHIIKISQFRGFKNLLQNSYCLLFPFVFS